LAKTYIYIDGQNVGPNILPNLNKSLSAIGIRGGVKRYYHSRNDDARLSKEKKSKFDENEVDIIAVNCQPAKNSVDIRIAVDSIETSCIDSQSETFIFVTNDSDFSHVTSRIINFGKNVYLFHTRASDHSSYSANVKKHNIGVPAIEKTAGALVQRATRAVKDAVPDKIKSTAKQTANILQGKPKETGHYDAFDKNKLIAGLEESGGIIIPSDKMYRTFKEVYNIEWNRGVPKIQPQVFADLFFGKNVFRFVLLKTESEFGDGFYINNIISRASKIPRKPRELIASFGCSEKTLVKFANNLAEYIKSREFHNFKGDAFQGFVQQMPVPRNIGYAFTNLIYEELGRPEAGSTKSQMLRYTPVDMITLFRQRYKKIMNDGELVIKLENPKNDLEKQLAQRIERFSQYING
jgi:NYN domain